MARYVKVSVIGTAPFVSGRSPLENNSADAIAHLELQLSQVLPDQPDLIVLPEFCDMNGSNTVERYRDACTAGGDRVLQFISGVAKAHRLWITYPALRFAPQHRWRNSIQLIDRNGEVAGCYDKNHLTIAEMEAGIECGNEVPLVQTDFGTVAMAICFDLNFDELRARVAALTPDLILFCSMYHGGLMQEYWAYSCRAHFAAAVTNLPSRIISPVGQTIASTTNYTNFTTATINLDCQMVHLDYHAEKLRDLKRKYGPGVTILDPGLLAPVLVTSEIDGVGIDQMLEEFGIEPLDRYLERSRCEQQKNRSGSRAPSEPHLPL